MTKKSGVDLSHVDFEGIARQLIDNAIAEYRASSSSSVAKSVPPSAVVEVQQRIASVLAKSDVTAGQALDQVFAEDRAAGGDLFERWRRESCV